MIKFLILFLVMIPFLFSGAAKAADAGRSSRYIIMMKDTLSPTQEINSVRSRLAFLRQNAEASQKSILSLLSKYRNFNVKSLYSINSLLATLSKEELKIIQARSDVRKVIPDTPVSLPKTFPGIMVDGDYGDYTFGLFNMRIPEVRKNFNVTGRNVFIGHIDTGVDASHPDLSGKIHLYKDFTSNSSVPTDTQGHGTHTAATIVGGNAGGIHIGVAPDARLIVARGIGSTSKLLESMEWMLDPDGTPETPDQPKAVSCSWHSGYGDQTAYYEMIEKWIDCGIIPCFSAGNSGPGAKTITKPKEHPGTFANAAVDNKDEIASFSSRGPGIYKGTETAKPDFSAPGKDVYSAKNGGGYTSLSGTSMACPHAAGVIALLFEANPSLSVDQVRNILTLTSVDLGETGYDYTYGHGRIDACQAVSIAISGGKVKGKVSDRNGRDICADILVKPANSAYKTDKTGNYMIVLQEGKYQIVYSAFSYLPTAIEVVIKKDQTQIADIVLNKAPEISVRGTVSSKLSGEPLKSRIRLLEHPEISSESEDNGKYLLKIPAGTFKLEVSSFGYQTAVTDHISFQKDTTLDFQLSPLPQVLLVDDDKGQNYESFYRDALDKLGISYDHKDMSRKRILSDLEILPYSTVIWFTGSDSSSTLSDKEMSLLADYLKSGGTLLLSGQDIGYNIKDKPFYKDFLHAKYVKDSSPVKKVTGKGLEFSIENGNGANNQKYPDVLECLSGAESYFEYSGNNGCAGLRVQNGQYALIYLGFGFEGISTADDRIAAMKLMMEDLKPSLSEQIKRIIRISEVHPHLSTVLDVSLATTLDSCRTWELESAKRFIFNHSARGIFSKSMEKIDNLIINR